MTARERADRLLVARGLFESRAKAQAAIAAGLVTADDRPVQKPSDELPLDARIAAAAAFPWVSRGGVKLAHALDALGDRPDGQDLPRRRRLDRRLHRGAARARRAARLCGRRRPRPAAPAAARAPRDRLARGDRHPHARCRAHRARRPRGDRRELHLAQAGAAGRACARGAARRAGRADQAAVRGAAAAPQARRGARPRGACRRLRRDRGLRRLARLDA